VSIIFLRLASTVGFAFVCFMLSIAAPIAARAATLVGSSITFFATGVDGLVIDGTTYNVTFTQGSYNSVFSATPPTFLNNAPGALDAANALASALDTLIGPYIGFFDELIPSSNSLVSFDGLQVAASSGTDYSVVPGGNFDFTQESSDLFSTPISVQGFAVFSVVSPVPVPSTWALFLTGLAGIGFVASRASKKNGASLAA
jgi:hypothetical protein